MCGCRGCEGIGVVWNKDQGLTNEGFRIGDGRQGAEIVKGLTRDPWAVIAEVACAA